MALAVATPNSSLDPLSPLPALLAAVASLVRELRLTLTAVLPWMSAKRSLVPYVTLWLELVLDLSDVRGERAILTRRQGIRMLRSGPVVVRELVWGEGNQLARYASHGARRLGLRQEGSKRAVLLELTSQPSVGARMTITSRRTIHSGFRAAEEYCEAFLEQPTGHLDLTVRFPRKRPPSEACLVMAASETVLRRLRPRYGADGRAVLRCRIRRPATAATYSLRWSW